MRVAMVTVVVGCLALAGCASGTEVGPEGAETTQGPEAFLEGMGGVEGYVTDDELQPIAAADVGLVEVELRTQTDAAGHFSFGNVEPGTYTLAVQRLGYESNARQIDVVAGEVVEVTIQIAVLAVVEAYHVTMVFQGHMTCGMDLIVIRLVTVCGTTGTGTPAGNVTVDPNEKNDFPQEGLTTLATVVAEVVWEPNAAVAAAAFQINLYQGWVCDPFCSSDYQYGQEEGPSPLVMRSEGFDGLEEVAGIINHFVSVTDTDGPPFVTVVFQQDFTLYSTHFHGLEAPESYSALPDA